MILAMLKNANMCLTSMGPAIFLNQWGAAANISSDHVEYDHCPLVIILCIRPYAYTCIRRYNVTPPPTGWAHTNIYLCMRPANDRWRCNVNSFLIGWAHIQDDPWSKPLCKTSKHYTYDSGLLCSVLVRYLTILHASIFSKVTSLLLVTPGLNKQPWEGRVNNEHESPEYHRTATKNK